LKVKHKENMMAQEFLALTQSVKFPDRWKENLFDTQADADAHVTEYGGFVVDNPGGSTSYWVVDEAAQTVVNDQAQADADALASSWASLRTERNTLLASSDWTQSPDSPLADEAKSEWAVHREALRDLPVNTPDPVDPTWPDAPEEE
jgi:hypothetical protein